MPFPFPEALQEFKVETSALTAQYGYHSAAVVNADHQVRHQHGSRQRVRVLRDDSMNATDPFAAIGPDGKRRSDGLNRNQFGGSFGGPIVRDRLFYFGAYQRTRVRRSPDVQLPVHADARRCWPATSRQFASPAVPRRPAARPLRAPFVNNQVSPAMFSPASLKLVEPARRDARQPVRPGVLRPRGQQRRGRVHRRRSTTTLQRIALDLRPSAVSTSTTRRPTTTARRRSPSASRRSRIASTRWRVGDTKLFGNNVVNAFRATLNRGNFGKDVSRRCSTTRTSACRATPVMADYMRLAVTGGFSMIRPARCRR